MNIFNFSFNLSVFVVILKLDLFLALDKDFFKSRNVSSSVLVLKSILTSFCEKFFFDHRQNLQFQNQ